MPSYVSHVPTTHPGFKKILRLCLCLSIVLAAFSGLHGQIPKIPGIKKEKPDTLQQEEVILETVIPIPDISIKALETRIQYKAYRGELYPEATRKAEQAKVTKLVNDFIPLKKSQQVGIIDRLNIRALENLRREMGFYRTKFEDEQKSLKKEIQNLNEIRKSLYTSKLLWEDTRASIIQQGAPASLTDKTDNVLTDNQQVAEEISEQMEFFLSLLDQITEEILTINDIQGRLFTSINHQQSSAASLSGRPIWEVFQDSQPDLSAEEVVQQLFQDSIRHFKTFFRENEEWFLIHIIFTVFLFFVLVYIKRNITFRDDKDLEKIHKARTWIFSRPFSTCLVISILIGFFLFPQAPILVTDMLSLILLPPLLILVSGLLPKMFRRPLILLGIAFVLVKIHGFNTGFPLLDRSLILLINGIVLWTCWTMLRPGSAFKALPKNRPVKIGKVALILSVIMMGVSILANPFGGIYMSELLTTALIKTVFSGLLFYTTSVILVSLFAIALQSKVMQSLRIVRRREKVILKKIASIIWNVSFLLWLFNSFRVFNVVSQLYQGISKVLMTTWQFGSLELSLGKVIAFFITIWLSVVVSRIIRAILEDEVYERVRMPRGLPSTISMLVRYSIITLGFFLAVAAAGIPMDSLAIIFGAFSVGIGFGLQNIFNNLVSGLILAFERPIQVGDIIEVGPLLGRVRSIGIRSSKVRTLDGAEVIVPNGQLISNEVVNWTLSDQLRRIRVHVGLAYGTDVELVKEILLKAAQDHPEVEKIPSPLPLFIGFGNSSLDFELLMWTSRFDDFPRVKSEVASLVNSGLAEAGLEIPFPQRDINFRNSLHSGNQHNAD